MERYKIWAIIERETTHESGYEEWEDLDETTTCIGSYDTLEEALDELNKLDKNA